MSTIALATQPAGDEVAAALEILIGEIESAAGEIAIQGAAAFREQAYDRIQGLGAEGVRLQGFLARVKELRADWEAGLGNPGAEIAAA